MINDAFSKHEVLHTTHVIDELFAREILDHPAVLATPEWQRQAEEISGLLGALYQQVGSDIL